VLLPRGAPALRHTACPVRRAFSAIATVTLTCDACGAVSRSRELSRALSLEVPPGGPGAPPMGVAALLARAFAAERGVERACEACGGRTATLARALHRLPRVLVLHLKRFKATPLNTAAGGGGVTFTKCCTRVAAPHMLSLAPHVRGAGAPRPPPALAQAAVAAAAAAAAAAPAPAPSSAWAEAGDDSDLAAALAASAADADARAAAAEDAALAEALAASAADAAERATADGTATASQSPPPDADADSPRAGGAAGVGVFGHGDAADVAERLSDSEESCSPRRAPENVSLSYRLHGLVSHVGASAAAGHYTADVWDGGARAWRRHDDARVAAVSEAAVFCEAAQESAYLLVYVHVPTPQAAAARPAHAPLQRQP
jgi:hypothetical protein